MDNHFRLTENFISILKLCPPLEKYFAKESPEYTRVKIWLEKLTRYECTSLEDSRLRFMYISYLVAGINERKLMGPFAKEPTAGRLKLIKFDEPLPEDTPAEAQPPSPPPQVPPSINDVHTQKPAMTIDASEPVQSASTHFSVHEAGPQGDHAPTPNDYMSLDISPNTEEEVKGEEQTAPPIADIDRLLNSITQELCGHKSAGCDPLLESKLKRYKKFILTQSPLKCKVKSLKRSSKELRIFLMANLLTDLQILKKNIQSEGY